MREIGSSPSGEHITLASFPEFQEAEDAVEILAENNFPVQFVSIVADGLQVVQNADRLAWLRHLTFGIVLGTIVGAAVTLILVALNITNEMQPVLTLVSYGILGGGIVGGLLNMVLHWMFSGRKDLSSSPSFHAKYYDVRVHKQYEQRARTILSSRVPSLRIEKNVGKTSAQRVPPSAPLRPQTEA